MDLAPIKYFIKGGLLKSIKYCPQETLKVMSILKESTTRKIEALQIRALRHLSYLICSTSVAPKPSFRILPAVEEKFEEFELSLESNNSLRSRGGSPLHTPFYSNSAPRSSLSIPPIISESLSKGTKSVTPLFR